MTLRSTYSASISESEQKEQINRVKVILLVFFVFGIIFLTGIIGQLPNGYVDADGIENWVQVNSTKLLLGILFIDIVFVCSLFTVVRKLIVKTSELLLIISLSSIMCYFFLFLNRKNSIALINRMGRSASFEIHGVVMNKLVTTNRRGSNHFYAITVTDTVTTRNYYFTVSDYIFKRTSYGEVFNKTFNRGQLGIIYRKEEE